MVADSLVIRGAMKKKNFTKLIQLWGILLILGVAGSIVAIDAVSSYRHFHRRSAQIRADYIEEQKQLIKQEVTRVVQLIAYEKSQTEELTREKIKQRVLEAYAIAQNIYKQNKTIKKQTEIQAMILDALREIRFAKGIGYYFATHFDGTEILFADKPELEGKNLFTLQDTRGQFVIQDMIKIARESEEGFYEYHWTKPDMEGNDYKKISFVKRFTPYDWFIGTGLYVADTQEDIKNRVLLNISRIRFGKEGYIFVNRFNGDALVSNGKYIGGTKKLWEVFSKNPEKAKYIYDISREAALTPEGGYVYYSLIKMSDSTKESPKVSFVFGVPEFKWYVGAGVYLDDVETRLVLLQNRLTEIVRAKAFFYLLSALVIVVLFLFLLNRFTRNLRKDFTIFSSFFKQAAFSDRPIDRSLVQFDELDQMAVSANTMLQNKIRADEQLAMFKKFAETSSQGMGWATMDGEIQYANIALASLLGEKDQRDVIGNNIVSAYYPETEQLRLQEEIFPSVLENGAWGGELLLQTTNGELVPTQNSLFLIYDDAAEPMYFANIVTDISSMKEAEIDKDELTQKLHRAQKMEAIGLMAGGVAHDLNNILSGIIAYPELILHELDDESELRQPIEAIMESGYRAATVVADLLTVARGAASIRENHNLNDLVLEYLQSPEYQKLESISPAITCRHKLEAVDATISCSPVHVKKCIMNLITNASEAIADSGTVLVTTYNQTLDGGGGETEGMAAGDYIVLSVEDNGAGITQTDLEHIFEPFYTKKTMGRSGTGLGLAVVWNTMEDHDGKVFVESSAHGTRFQLFFPGNNDEQDVQVKAGAAEDFTGNGERILIVDDEEQLRDIASKMLLSLQYKVDVVASGRQAIDFVRETPVDLIVLDMLMEPGLDGRETYEQIVKLYPTQKAIVVSGFSDSADVQETIQLGADGFIKKPYSTEQLGLAVKRALSN